MMATLAATLSAKGHPVFRFDRRGVGDSSGADPGFRDSAPDIASAVNTFRHACPHVEKLIGLGLCDGAAALALHARAVGLDALILLNPWVVEAEAGSPAPAAVRAHYRERLLTLAGWRKLLTRGFNPIAALRGLRSALSPSDQGLAHDVMTSLVEFPGPIRIVLAERDATARAFLGAYRSPIGALLNRSPQVTLALRDSASHSFASAADRAWLGDQVLAALKEI
jgi:exosortase A-associated hydrolase 1